MNELREGKCCNESPTVWRCNHGRFEHCECDVEKIECNKCGRLIWGADEDSVKEWNSGASDESIEDGVVE